MAFKGNKVPITAEEMRGIAQVVHKQLHGQAEDGETDTKIPCVIPHCKGTIIEEKNREYIGDPMHRIIGPGGKNQLSLIIKYYCSRCKIMYHSLPEKVRK